MKDKNEEKKLLDSYCLALSGKYSKNGIGTRKKYLKKVLAFFKTKDEFDRLIVDNPKYTKFIRDNFSSNPNLADIKNAISIYAQEVLKVSLYSNINDIKSALAGYAQAVDAFDSFSEFSTANIVGEYGEYLICRKFHLDRSYTNNKSVDATFNGGFIKVQIKARWIRNKSLYQENIEFGEVNENEIDYFVGVIFDHDFNVAKCIIINKANLPTCIGSKKKRVVIFNQNFENSFSHLFENRLNNHPNKW